MKTSNSIFSSKLCHLFLSRTSILYWTFVRSVRIYCARNRWNCCCSIYCYCFSYANHSSMKFFCAYFSFFPSMYTAISRKVVGESALDNREKYRGLFWVRCSSKKFERMAREAIDVCLRMLKESNNGRFDSCSVRNSVFIISHITFRDCRVHSFSDNLSQNSCIFMVRAFEYQYPL